MTQEIINALFSALDLLEELAKGIAEGKEEDAEADGVIQLLKQAPVVLPRPPLPPGRKQGRTP